jgi:clostripain
MHRPLDYEAVIPGSHSQGEWVEFTHALGPDPQSLHPMKVYSQDYATLWGVGKYATPFGEYTASYDMFGDGRDGDLVISSNTTFTPIDSSCFGSQGTKTLYASNAAFQAGQKILIHQTRGTNAGVWEINQIASYTSGVITTEKPLQYTYTDGVASQAQVLVLRQYHNMTVNSGATWTVKAWDGNTGGILGFLANGTVRIDGIISASGGNGNVATLREGQIVLGGVGGGFRGGAGKANNPTSGTGFQGEGTSGEGGQSINANGNGGGGGNSTGAPGAQGGGGGGHSNFGQAGQDGGEGNPGQGGMISGNSVLSIMTFGGGGGGAGREAVNSVGSGGSGGGIILIFANKLTLRGNILSNGGKGGIADGRIEASGGGGAGGSILIRTNIGSLGSNNIKSLGGLGNGNGNYGLGSFGRIHIDYCDEIIGNTEPAASTQKLNCYIAEQVESAPYTTTRLNLPETFSNSRAYKVQYGRHLNFSVGGAQTTVLRVPAGQFSAATLDAVVMNTGSGELTFRLDIGANGIWDWAVTQKVNGSATLSSPDLATAFNAYWTSQGSPISGNVDVPVVVWFSHSGRVLLTNLFMLKLEPPPGTPNPTSPPPGTPEPTPPSSGQKPWTFMLYLDGDNDLYPYLNRAISQLEAQTANPNLNIVVLFDGDRNNDSWRFVVQPGGNYTIGSNRWYMGELNMGDPQTLSSFITWARANYPAQHYYLAIADHGRGTSGLAWDDTNNKDYLSTAELRSALQTATNSGQWKIDVLHYDACLMALLENAYQVKDYADFLVASQNLGWSVFAYDAYARMQAQGSESSSAPYEFAELVASVTASTTPRELAVDVANAYFNHSALSGYPRTISVLDLSKSIVVRQAVDGFATVLRDNLSGVRTYIQNARSATQKFDSREYFKITDEDEYVDLYHLAEKAKQYVSDSRVQNAAQGVMEAVTGFVVVERHWSGIWGGGQELYWDLDNAHGVSIYFPPRSGSSDYSRYTGHQLFRFTAESIWDEFLMDYFGVMGLPPESPTEPGLPPMLIPDYKLYLPLVLRTR